MKHHFITVEGNIGVGKTTLTHLLAKHFNARIVLEEFADNPFLAKFYENPKQYAFPVELFFMAERYKQLKDMLHTKDLFQNITIADYLFTKCLLFAKVNSSEEEFRLYQKFYDIIHQQITFPDILIYLHAPVNKLQANIKKRNKVSKLNFRLGLCLALELTAARENHSRRRRSHALFRIP